ncbi:MAG: ABC transporter [Epsilonproteobacteria bacterium]|nr:ABC transporter [Campylobacterota bacterium]
MNNSSLSIKNIYKTFEQSHINTTLFTNLSYTFKQGSSYAIMGASGIGKSTLLHMLAGLEQPSAGTILLNNLCLSKIPLEQKIPILQQSIGLVFQQPLLIPELTVIENIVLKSIIDKGATQQDIKKAKNLLQEVGLLEKAYCMPHLLSGGQQQRIALLRAIFKPPQFLLADEPTGNLDISTGNDVLQLLLQYQKKYHIGLIVSTHDKNIAQNMDYILEVKNQQIFEALKT